MMMKGTYRPRSAYRLMSLLSVLLFICVTATVNAQEPPPRPVIITANASQPLAFGAFSRYFRRPESVHSLRNEEFTRQCGIVVNGIYLYTRNVLCKG
jgi:hypothetical protein